MADQTIGHFFAKFDFEARGEGCAGVEVAQALPGQSKRAGTKGKAAGQAKGARPALQARLRGAAVFIWNFMAGSQRIVRVRGYTLKVT